MPKYSIGVVTYVNRFEEYFKPLVNSLDKIFPGYEKNYVLNGYYDQEKQEKYLKDANNFLRSTSAGKIISYNQHQSLSKCWNQLLINSKADKVLILNDDLKISRLFKFFINLQANLYDTAVINRSWSHFFVSKDTIKRVGWFDERFLGMGSEDADYALRLAIAAKKTVMPNNYLHNLYCLGVKNVIAHDTDPGWKQISNFSQGKYSEINYKFFHEKWDVCKQTKKDYLYGFKFGYYNIKPGMETPLFYPLSVLDKKP